MFKNPPFLGVPDSFSIVVNHSNAEEVKNRTLGKQLNNTRFDIGTFGSCFKFDKM